MKHKVIPSIRDSAAGHNARALFFFRCVVLIICIAAYSRCVSATDLIRLSQENWGKFAPVGKEVDAIYGDFLLRNDKFIVVLGNPVPGRNGNMTLGNVGGMVIDLTLRDKPNDQLSAFYTAPDDYPDAKTFEPKLVRIIVDGIVHYAAPDQGNAPVRLIADVMNAHEISLVFGAPAAEVGHPSVEVEYRLADGESSLRVATTYVNPYQKPIKLVQRDTLRVDGAFDFGLEGNLCWAYDPWWEQAYGIVAEDAHLTLDPLCSRNPQYLKMFGPMLRYESGGLAADELMPGGSCTLVRRIFPACDTFQVKAVAAQLRNVQLENVSIRVFDLHGPIARALVEVLPEQIAETSETTGAPLYGSGRTSHDGLLHAPLAPGKYALRVTPIGRAPHVTSLDVPNQKEVAVAMPLPGYVVATISDEAGHQIPCKVGFYGQNGTPDPCFGPDSGIHGVRNLYYTHTGRFHVEIVPGRYTVVVSHGPEYDAVVRQLNIGVGEKTEFAANLIRTVDTTGWISADLHSHTSPSGDNTASQRGRVLNNLAEHLEFCPCTEHNLISSFLPHLQHFGATGRMLTCSGIELTGDPLLVNHQNAFPLTYHPHTQNGGGPEPDVNPVDQIERLASWDDGSDKLVQINHPNIVQILADRDLDGKYDGGFAKMLSIADVIEVHPLDDIFNPPESRLVNDRQRSKSIFHWLQLLNLGYRLAGVVNTDAHLNFHKLYDPVLLGGVPSSEFDWNLHGAGAWRNYIRSSTDDPGKASVSDLCRTAERRAVVMTNGPFLEVRVSTLGINGEAVASVGDDLVAPNGRVRLHVRVQCANWLQVNRVQLFLNGRAAEDWNLTRRTHPQYFHNGPVVFDGELDLSFTGDTNIIVVAAGEGQELGVVMGPDAGKMMPIAVTNPIFVDIDGNGFEPNGDVLDFPLPVAD